MVERRTSPLNSQDNGSSDEDVKEQQSPFRTPVSREQVNQWSRSLHKNAPPNLYHREKIPYKTILIALLFLIGGVIFLSWGVVELQEKSILECGEFFALGLILFIPGSYHTFMAFQACRGAEGYGYDNLTVFENDEFYQDD